MFFLQKLVAHSMKAGLWLFVLWFLRHSTVFETTSLSVAFGSKQEILYRYGIVLFLIDVSLKSGLYSLCTFSCPA